MSFKDNAGRWVTLGLFKDKAGSYKGSVIWDSVDDARKDFIACEDPTGIAFADQYLGGYDHWIQLKQSKGMEEDIAKWEEELEARMRSKALLGIKAMSEDHFQAAKFLMDRGWEKRGAGRPTNEQVQKEARVQAKIKDDYNADVIRIKR